MPRRFLRNEGASFSACSPAADRALAEEKSALGAENTALFSNTPRAHRLGMTRDWVVLYDDDGAGERQHTVLTAMRGPLAGKRVVAGREEECVPCYARTKAHAVRAAG